MTYHVRHEPCPKCGSRDNLSRYSDESAWCWGCGYLEKSPLEVRLKQLTQPEMTVVKSTENILPDDATEIIMPQHLAWLKQYGLTNDEISQSFLSIPSRNSLACIIERDPETQAVLSYQERNFDRKPKYLTYGKVKNHIWSPRGLTGEACVMVEDAVSAIKVSRVLPAVALFGCNLDRNTATRLSRLVDGAYIWLDPDKRLEATLIANRLGWLFKDGIHVIWSDKDPKEHTMSQIEDILNVL